MKFMGNFLIYTGILVTLFGLLINIFHKFNLPLIPGDILIQKGNFTLFFPIITSLIISIILTIIFNLFK
ncbi:hypothetical protein A2Y99_05050 [Candidatus Gottesmanbacteria bacterium RBG_13_37_7]|uniref:DUF2905 domain-containing protein n=1 Tax=Candidatus Gottesmanbacteria bacterium RBG_13_37_7 TaxID=1798369 RepID=A0A1F5YH56_9BACT|nr:MAG: hypothetical protein A2Y99_05050 [Candidatus Gottesmanbacteria bacterium RBG_13_37_7]